MTLPYVLRILVTDGDPDGVRVVDKSNWTGKGVIFPRQLLKSARSEGLETPGIYVLIGEDDSGESDRRIYVGQGEDVGKRLANHLGSDDKEFWSETVAFVSSSEPLNRAHISYLESKLIERAHAAGRSAVANGTRPSLPSMSAADRAEAEGYLLELLNILPAIGFDFFTIAEVKDVEATIYRLDERNGSGEGSEQPDGFLVKAGAKARKDVTPSFPAGTQRVRDNLIRDCKLTEQGDHFLLTEDTLFRSPSIAAGLLVGASINGREAWVDTAGVTLKQRQIEEVSE